MRDDLDDMLERAAHLVLMQFCECHLSDLTDTAIALLPIRDGDNAMWSEHLTTACDPTHPT
jgi:hypothetical protein